MLLAEVFAAATLRAGAFAFDAAGFFVFFSATAVAELAAAFALRGAAAAFFFGADVVGALAAAGDFPATFFVVTSELLFVFAIRKESLGFETIARRISEFAEMQKLVAACAMIVEEATSPRHDILLRRACFSPLQRWAF